MEESLSESGQMIERVGKECIHMLMGEMYNNIIDMGGWFLSYHHHRLVLVVVCCCLLLLLLLLLKEGVYVFMGKMCSYFSLSLSHFFPLIPRCNRCKFYVSNHYQKQQNRRLFLLYLCVMICKQK